MNRATLTLALSALLTVGTATAAAPAGFAYETLPGVSPEPIPQGAGLKSKEELETFLDGVFVAQMRAQHIAGAIVTVVKDGKIFFTKGYGLADVEKRTPVDPEKTLFRPGSVSKIFTWTALMQLVEQGKVKLDDDVNNYVTQFKIPDTYPGKPITIKNLLTHTEGLEDGGFGYLIVDKAERMEDPAETLKNHMPQRVREPASGDFTNGDMSSYSNWGTALAGLIVANVSGMSYEDYIDKHILEPLDMKHSTARQPLPPELAADMATGYKYEASQYKPRGFEFVNFAPAGSMSASAVDMGKFMIAHLQKGAYGNGRILKAETAELMQARALSPNPHINGACLGFYENHVNGRRFIVHGGDTAYFHSEMNLIPEEGVGIFVSVNTAPSLQFSTRSDLVRAFMERYYPAKLPQLKAPADFKQRVANYAGSYRLIRHSYSKFEKMFSVMNTLKVTPTDHDTLLVTFGPYGGEVVEVKPNVFRRVDQDDMIAFSVDAGGKATYVLDPISLPNHTAYRLRAYETPTALGFIAGFAVLCFLVAIVSALRHWKADRVATPGARRARRGAALLAATNTVFLAVAGLFAATISKTPFSPLPASFKASLVLPLIAIPLTLAVLVFAVQAWQAGWWTRYGRAQYTAIALGSVAFLWLLNYVNLVGYNIG
jgi:CubicO group peptidase (beta-lactamase class C family)